jgi:hypothetical protein
MQGFGHFIVLIHTGAATQDFRQPELPYSTLHVLDFALRGLRCPNPL